MATKPIKIKITGDSGKFEKSLNGIHGSLGRLTKGLGAVAAGMAAAFAVGTVSSAIGGLYNLGSELQLLDTKIDTVFADKAGTVREWADGLNESLGLSETQVAALAASTADLLKPMGFTADEAANMSMEMTELSGALSMWSGGQYDAAEVSDIMTKAMLGETDGLKALGISINAAEIEQRALEVAMADGRTEITAMDKALATQALIMEKSTDAQDAYAESQDGMVGKTNQLKAAWADLKEDLARKLIPVFTALATFAVDKLLPALEDMQAKAVELWDEWGPTVMQLKDQLIGTLKDLAETWFPRIVAVIDIVKGAFSSGGEGASALSERFQQVKQVISSAMTAVQAVIQRVWTIVQWVWENAGEAILDNLMGFIDHVNAAFQNLVDFITEFFNLITAIMTGDWSAAWEAIKGMLSAALDFIANIIGAAWDVVGALFAVLKETLIWLMSEAWEGIKSAVSAGIDIVVQFMRDLPGNIVEALGDLLGLLVSKGEDLLNGFQTGVDTIWELVKSFFVDLPGNVLDALGALDSILESAGEAILNGLWTGMKAVWEDIKGWLSDVTDLIPDWKGPAEKDRKLLRPAGQLVMTGFQEGLEDGYAGVKNALQGMTTDVAITGAAGAAAGGTGGRGSVTVNVKTDANPHEIGHAVAWAMRTT